MLSVMRMADAQISFADAEMLAQGIELDPLLQKISDFIDDHEELVELVRGDLERGLKKPKTGRKGLNPSQVLRSLLLMRIKNWDYRELCASASVMDIRYASSRAFTVAPCPNITPSIRDSTD